MFRFLDFQLLLDLLVRTGSDQVNALAAKAGISPEAAGSAIAQLLPTIVDKLTPNGQVPAHNSVMEMVGGLLQKFGKAS